MARKKTTQPPPPKQWTPDEINRGIQKLQRRASEVKSLLESQVNYNDPRVESQGSEIVATIEDVFGTGSREHEEHSYVSLRPGSMYTTGFRQNPSIADRKNQAAFLEYLPTVIGMLEGLIRRLEEKKESFKKCPQCNRAFDNQIYCLNDGTPLVDLSYSSEAETLPMSGTQSIEERLITLAELKNKGLIGNEDFEARKQKILDEV